MHWGVSLLCVFVCFSTIDCDRVYVHPFYLISYNTTSGCNLVEVQEQLGKTFIPIPIDSDFTPPYEESLGNKTKEKTQYVDVNFFSDMIYVLGARFYQKLREMHKDENIILSPTEIYKSLLLFYLGASGKTADDLQILLGLESPTINSSCNFRVDGHKVLSTVRFISDPLLPKQADGLLFSKVFCLFSAPGVPLSESFVHNLGSPDVTFWVRTVDFRNSTQAAEKINAFVEGKNTHRSKSLLANIDPQTTLLLATYTQFKATVKGAFPLKEPQEFWLSSDTKVSVPMIRVTDSFEHKYDENLLIIKIPVNKDVFLLLLQPINGSNLAKAEEGFDLKFPPERRQLLPSREIHLTLPKFSLKSIYDLQELIVNMNVSTNLGNKANLTMLSDTSLTVRKIINQQLFELSPGGTDPAEDHSGEHNATTALKITVNGPFLVAVYGSKSKTLLYLGRVTNPLEGANIHRTK
ncbi:angiotensinogen [Hemicordylus capensis]|uniref:angiotensinogen n=1 Tax=Hemicordylus capensis TaxID=884348 RepID=UPI002303CFC1|nr:angiotensinogen [Hemicordylus capensis]